MNLSILPGRYAVSQLPANAALPAGCLDDPFASVTRTQEELSLVVPETQIQPSWTTETGWRIIQVAGPLDFSLVGILANLAATLAEAGVSIYALSTYNTDYILVKESDLDQARQALTRAGHTILKGEHHP